MYNTLRGGSRCFPFFGHLFYHFLMLNIGLQQTFGNKKKLFNAKSD